MDAKMPRAGTGSLGSLAKNEWWFTQGAKFRKRRQASPLEHKSWFVSDKFF